MSPNIAGALLMMASMAAFTLNDTFIKATDGALPLNQLLFLRSVLSTVLIIALARWQRTLHFRISPGDWLNIAIRSAAEVGAAYFFITALLNMPLANITAILQILPLTVTLGSALFFKEHVGWRRGLAIAVGFCGMLLIVLPEAGGFSIWSFYALMAVLCITIRDLVTRRLSPGAPSMTVTLAASVVVLICFGLGSLGTDWAPVTPSLGLLIAGAALFVIGGYFFSIQVMRTGDVSFTAPFRYTGLVWALLLGWLFFGDWPAPITLLGAAIVVTSGLFTLYRERQLLRS